MTHDWLTPDEAAEYAGVHPATIRWAIRKGRLRCRRPTPRKTRVTRVAIDNWLKNEKWHEVGRPRKLRLDNGKNMLDNRATESTSPDDESGLV